MSEVLQLVSAHSPALTPYVILLVFFVVQLQLRRWRPAIVQHVAMTNAIGERLGVTEKEEHDQEEKAEASLPSGVSVSDLLSALSTAAIERDNALRELSTLKAALLPAATSGSGSTNTPAKP